MRRPWIYAEGRVGSRSVADVRCVIDVWPPDSKMHAVLSFLPQMLL